MSNFSIKQIRGGVSITKYLGEEIEITVPDTIDGYRVLRIEDKCFFGNKKVKKIIISDNVESIGELAFGSCTSLKDIVLPKNITEFGKDLFKGCKKLENVFYDTTEYVDLTEAFISDEQMGFNIKMPQRLRLDDYDWTSTLFDGFYLMNSPVDKILTGYDIEYDCVNKKVSKTDAGIYYFEKDGGIVITHGKKPYDFSKTSLVIPARINNKPVVAIGCEAFKNAKFISLELPETIKVISAHAFMSSKFDYLRLPEKLDYLNNNWVGEKNFFDDMLTKNFTLQTAESLNFSNVVVFPKEIKDLDRNSLKSYCCKYIFPVITNYDVNETYDRFSNVNYDIEHNVIYRKNKNSITILFASKSQNMEDIPTEIDGLIVDGISTDLIKHLTRNVILLEDATESEMEKITKNDSKDEDGKLTIKLDLENVPEGKVIKIGNLNSKIDIPENIKHIYCFFEEYVDYNSFKITFSSQLNTLEGINASDEPFVLPLSVKEINKVKGLIYLLQGSSIKPYSDDDVTVVSGISKVEENEDYRYVVLNGEVSLIKYIGNKEEVILPSFIDNLPIKHSLLKYPKTVKRFVFDNMYFKYDRENDKKNINISFDDHLDYFEIGGSLKRIDLLKDVVPSYTTKKIIISEGLEDIVGDNEEHFFSFTNSEPEKEEDKVTILLPKSLKHVGKKGLCDLDICYINAYNETVFDEEATEEFAKINYLDGVRKKTNTSKNKPNKVEPSKNEEKITYEEYPSLLIEKIMNYDLSSVSQQTMDKAKKVLNSNLFYDFDDDRKYVVSICYKGTAGDYYISISLDSDEKLAFYCSCPSYNHGYSNMKCKHIFALILYIQNKYKFTNKIIKHKPINENGQKRNAGFTVNNFLVNNAEDIVSAINYGTADFKNNHDENEAIELAQAMEIHNLSDNYVSAFGKGVLTTAQFSGYGGTKFTCSCNEHKTKTNPCVHTRALYYLLKKKDEMRSDVYEQVGYEEKNEDYSYNEPEEYVPEPEEYNNVPTNEPVNTNYNVTKSSGETFEKLSKIAYSLLPIAFVLLVVAIICAYSTKATLTMYATLRGEIVSRAMYTEYNIGKECGFFFVLMFLTTGGSLLSSLAITDKKKESIPFIISSIACFINAFIFSSKIDEYSFVNDITHITYYDDFKTIEESCIVSGPGGFVTFLFVIIALMCGFIAIVKVVKANKE